MRKLGLDRPEYVKCVKHTHADKQGESWCGRMISSEFAFDGVEAAAYEGLRGGRLLVCPQCLEKIEAALNGTAFIPR
jgi:hypothetical protein